MLLQVTSYSFVLLVNAFVLLVLSAYLLRKKAIKGALYLSLGMLAAGIWSLMGALEGCVLGAESKILASELSYVGIVFAGPLWLLFALDFTEVKEKIISIFRLCLLVISMLVLVVVFSNGAHHLFWLATTQQAGSDFAPVIYSHGPLFFLNMFYQYATLAGGVVLLFRYGVHLQGIEKRHILLSLLGVIVPWIANIYYVYGANSVGGYDLTPLAFSITGVVLAINFFTNRYYELLAVAKEKVLDSITSGIVIIDEQGAVVETNKAAQEMLGKDIKIGVKIAGKGIFLENAGNSDVFIKKVNKWVEVNKTVIRDAKTGEKGSIYYLHDITKQRIERERVQLSEFQSSSIIDFFPDPVFVINIEGKVIVWNKAMEKMTDISAEIMIGKGDTAYAIPFYGEKHRMIIDVVLEGSVPTKYYRDNTIHVDGETLSVILEGNGKSVFCQAKPLKDR